MDVHKPCIPYLAMILARILFAGTTLFTKTAVAGGMNPFVFVFYRQIFASLVLIPVIFFFERNKSLPPLPLFRIFIISLCGITLCSFLYTFSLRYTSATFAAASANAVPAITLLLALILRIEKLKKKHKFSSATKLLGTLLCLVGAFLFAIYKGPAVQFINHHEIQKTATSHAEKVISRADWVKGSLLMLLAHTCWSIWLILQGPLVRRYPAELRLTFLQCICSIIQTGLITVIFERKPSAWKLGWNIGLLASVYSGAATAVCSWLMTWCVDCKGAVFTAVFSPLTFLATVVYSIVFWNEILHWGSVGGAVMLVLGLYCVLWGKHKESSSSSPKQAQEMGDNMGH
ncbi:WAT1-related protein At1g43650-like isoform X1 [Dioscorea cayenensis subsp. rotundata]|uniref:WAT1-related protein n=2 Tax=Dioscorea cayennensis subsp. rotundata TaxID=55577 RepID=A0AB40C223_DIOCR|nr:WAT1-related protein At1g43650-like isoform X1 [Dioscorea cayenensis subsp. rotundata]